MRLNRDVQLLLRKALIYFTTIFISALLQTSFFAVVEPFGVVPDLMLTLSLGVGYFCGPTAGGIFGIVAGVITYALGDVGFSALPLVYFAVGSVTGFLVENFFTGKFTVWCLYVFVASLFKSFYSLLCIVLFSSDVQLFTAVWHSVLPEFAVTLALGVALYVPIKKLCVHLYG